MTVEDRDVAIAAGGEDPLTDLIHDAEDVRRALLGWPRCPDCGRWMQLVINQTPSYWVCGNWSTPHPSWSVYFGFAGRSRWVRSHRGRRGDGRDDESEVLDAPPPSLSVEKARQLEGW